MEPSRRGKKEYGAGFSHGLRRGRAREIRPRSLDTLEGVADFHRLELSDR